MSSQSWGLPNCSSSPPWNNCYGSFTHASGDRYVGEWKNNKKHGKGIFTWADGRIYEGNYKDGKKHGKGTFTFANGKVLEGEWKNDLNQNLNTINSEYSFDGQVCETSKSDFNKIKDNCIISKLEPNSKSTLAQAVRNSCSRIACNPSFIEKLRFK